MVKRKFNKSDLVRKLQISHPQYSIKELDSIVRDLFGYLRDCVITGERVEIRGFGSFTTRVRSTTPHQSLKHIKTIREVSYRAIYFRASKMIKKILDE